MADDEPRRGPSKEAWGAIAAIAVAVIGAIVTLTTHFWSPSPKPAAPSSGEPTHNAADALAGHWAGTARDDGNPPFAVDVTIASGCAVGARCGTIFVANTPCRGALYLQRVNGNDFEFNVDDFVAPSDTTKCKAGAGEHFQPQPDGTVLYTTNYSGVRAVLARQ